MPRKIAQPEIKRARNICFYLEILPGDPSCFFCMHVTLSVPIEIEAFGGKLFSGMFCN